VEVRRRNTCSVGEHNRSKKGKTHGQENIETCQEERIAQEEGRSKEEEVRRRALRWRLSLLRLTLQSAEAPASWN